MRSLFFILLISLLSISYADSFSMERLRQERGESSYSATGDTFPDVAGSESVEEVSISLLILRIMGSLTILALIIVGFIWALKKSGLFSQKVASSPGSLELMDTLILGQSSSIRLVRFKESVLLLGVSGDSVNLLKTVEGEEAQSLISQNITPSPTVNAFKDQLHTFITTLKRDGGSSEI